MRISTGGTVLHVAHWSGAPEGSRPTLLALHGFVGSSNDWAKVAPALVGAVDVVAPDHRGHGRSTNTGDAATYTFEQLAADVDGVAGRCCPPTYHLLGHSMGGVLALMHVLAHPERVRSLILMDTAAEPQRAIPRPLITVAARLARGPGLERTIAAIARVSRHPLDEEARLALRGIDPEALRALAGELGHHRSLVPRLDEIRCPTTVLVGERDRGLRAAADQLATGIAGANLVVIPDAGHSPQTDNPHAWTTAVLAHLASVD